MSLKAPNGVNIKSTLRGANELSIWDTLFAMIKEITISFMNKLNTLNCLVFLATIKLVY